MDIIPSSSRIVAICMSFQLIGCTINAPVERDFLYRTEVGSDEYGSLKYVSKAARVHELLAKGEVQHLPDPVSFASEYSRQQGAPSRCIAFSGGGIRSAAFSMGVMAALNENGDLEGFDTMSAVSGGAYALSWYLVQQYNAINGDKTHDVASACKASSDVLGCARKYIFDRKKKTQKHIRRNSRLFTEELGASVFLQSIPNALPQLFLNGLFDRHENIGIPQKVYQDQLKVTFFSDSRGELVVPTAYELGKFVLGNKLPVFLINSTAWPVSDGETNLRMSDSVFTFSPLMYGSGAYGYYRYPDDEKLSQIPNRHKTGISILEVLVRSGAAVDFNMVPNKSVQTGLSVFAFSLGGYINNPAIGEDKRAEHQAKPFPLYIPRFSDLRGTGIYLSDGGHVENLGVFPLIQRNCSSITIVDGEHDPLYAFPSYVDLNKRLYDEKLNVRLVVPQIDENKTSQAEMGMYGNEDNFPDQSVLPSWRYFSKNKVMKGVLRRDGSSGKVDVPVRYVKLAYLPPDDISDPTCKSTACTSFYSESVPQELKYYTGGWARAGCNEEVNISVIESYYYCMKQGRLKKFYLFGPPAPFPQQPTRDQNFSSMQFSAYYELGRVAGLELHTTLASSPQ